MSLDSAVQTLVKRLEAVTARLESVEKQIASGAGAGALPAAAAAGPVGDDEVAPFVSDYDNLVNEYINQLGSLTGTIGSDELKAQVAILQKAVGEQRKFLAIASKSKKPDDATLGKLLAPTSTLMAEISAHRDKHRKSPQFNQLSTISEGISALGWVAVSPTPGPFVNEARASSEFYSNKILMEFKGKDENQLKWVAAWNTYLKELFNYIKKYHTTGLSWNPRGGDAASAASAPAAAPKAGGPPPPPGPPPPVLTAAPASGKAAGDTAALFAALNKGSDITSGLKKVTKDMKTSNLKDKSSVVPADAAKKETKAAAAAKGPKKGTPKFALEAKKWIVEWQEPGAVIDITETAPQQTVYIYKCERAVVKITGKVNNVTIDGCKKTGVVFDSAIACLEVVNSNGVEVQITGKVPSIAVDTCSSIQLILSKDTLHSEIVTSKSDQINVLIPDPNGGLDPLELNVPEQFKTTIGNGRLSTHAVEHKG